MVTKNLTFPPVSVIIPVFNGSKTFISSLDAIFNSDYPKFEVIVVDDKSTDNSVSIAKKFPCRVIEKKTNTGAADSRNKGAKAAKYNILFFTDSDCIVKKDTIKKIVSSFTKDIGIVAGTYSKKFYPKNNIYSSYHGLFCYYNYSNSSEALFGTQCCAIRKKIYFDLGGMDSSISGASVEDAKLQYQIEKSKYMHYVNMDAQVFHNSRSSFASLLKNYYKRPKLIKEIKNGYDLVLGSRFKGKIEHMPLLNRMGNIAFSKAVSQITRVKITDAQTGFRAFTREVAKNIPIISNHTYTQEQIIRSVEQKFSIKEIPIYFAKRSGKSKLIRNPFEYAVKAWINIIRIYRDFEPLKFLGLAGIFVFGIGFLIGLYLIFLHFTSGIVGHFALIMMDILILSIGLQIIIFGFLADMYKK